MLNAVPPFGHVIACEKWRRSALTENLKASGVQVLLEQHLSVVDFLLPSRSCVLYVSECDVVAGSSYKRKLVRYRNAHSSWQQMVLVERTRLSDQYFASLQKFVVLELGLSLLPVGGQSEASQLIAQMVQGESRENPFRRGAVSRLHEPLLVSLLQQVPGVGRTKALALLQSYPSLQELCGAEVRDLEPLVGHGAAQQVHRFLHKELI